MRSVSSAFKRYVIPTLRQLLKNEVTAKVLQTASMIAYAENQSCISLIHIFWASLEYLDPRYSRLMLNKRLTYQKIIQSKIRVRAPREDIRKKLLPLNRVAFETLLRASMLSHIGERDLDAQTILLALLSFSDKDVSNALTKMGISKKTAIHSWPQGEIDPDDISTYQYGLATYRALLGSGFTEQEIEEVVLKARYDMDFATTFQYALYVGAKSGPKVAQKAEPNIFLSLILGDIFDILRSPIFNFSGIDPYDFHRILNSRKVPAGIASSLRELVKLPWRK